jgi:hypothetical protein
MLKQTEKLMSKQNEDGSCTLESMQLVNTSVQKSELVFTCKMDHEEQPLIRASLILSTVAHTTYKPPVGPGNFTSFLTGNWDLLCLPSRFQKALNSRGEGG